MTKKRDKADLDILNSLHEAYNAEALDVSWDWDLGFCGLRSQSAYIFH